MPTQTTTSRSARPAKVPAPTRWTDTAPCANVTNPEMFFPLDEDGPDGAPARALCADCPLRARCLEYALATGMAAGIWGGLSTTEREALLADTRAARTAGGRR